jgi:hypothetical protein
LVRQKAPDVPIIVVTGYPPPAEGSNEVNAWLEKQELFPALLDKVRFFLGESGLQEMDLEETVKIV